MKNNFRNRISFPSVVLQQASRDAALAAMSEYSRAERQLALPREIRWNKASEIHRRVLSANALARSLAQAVSR